MTDEVLKLLTERGAKFLQLALGSHYMTYKGRYNVEFLECLGKMFWSQGYFSSQWRADGRVMCDIQCFNRTNPNYREFNRSKSSVFANEDLKNLPSDVVSRFFFAILIL